MKDLFHQHKFMVFALFTEINCYGCIHEADDEQDARKFAEQYGDKTGRKVEVKCTSEFN